MTKDVETYFLEGCGRCPLGGTSDCKVHTWTAELDYLRYIILECGLEEVSKWGVPCYTFQGKNVLILSAFKEFCCVSFFKGSLLSDEKNLLVKPTENSQSDRRFVFTDVEQIKIIEDDIKAYIFEAIEVERLGLKVEKKKELEPIPDELAQKFEELPELKTAFYELTKGRQRGYILYFAKAKQSKTRLSRIEKYIPKIFEGKGFHDR